MAALKSYPLDHNAGNWSAISGCTAALAGEGTQNASTRMLLASDLQENRPPVTANYAAPRCSLIRTAPDGSVVHEPRRELDGAVPPPGDGLGGGSAR